MKNLKNIRVLEVLYIPAGHNTNSKIKITDLRESDSDKLGKKASIKISYNHESLSNITDIAQDWLEKNRNMEFQFSGDLGDCYMIATTDFVTPLDAELYKEWKEELDFPE